MKKLIGMHIDPNGLKTQLDRIIAKYTNHPWEAVDSFSILFPNIPFRIAVLMFHEKIEWYINSTTAELIIGEPK